MSVKIIIGIVVLAIIVIAVAGLLRPQPRSKHEQFKCTGCGKFSPHTERTIDAWRNKKTSFFCPACHRQWLKSRPRPESAKLLAGRPATSKSGCLGMATVIMLFPIGAYLLLQTAAVI